VVLPKLLLALPLLLEEAVEQPEEVEGVVRDRGGRTSGPLSTGAGRRRTLGVVNTVPPPEVDDNDDEEEIPLSAGFGCRGEALGETGWWWWW
jgi:hypothetical protein